MPKDPYLLATYDGSFGFAQDDMEWSKAANFRGSTRQRANPPTRQRANPP